MVLHLQKPDYDIYFLGYSTNRKTIGSLGTYLWSWRQNWHWRIQLCYWRWRYKFLSRPSLYPWLSVWCCIHSCLSGIYLSERVVILWETTWPTGLGYQWSRRVWPCSFLPWVAAARGIARHTPVWVCLVEEITLCYFMHCNLWLNYIARDRFPFRSQYWSHFCSLQFGFKSESYSVKCEQLLHNTMHPLDFESVSGMESESASENLKNYCYCGEGLIICSNI